MARTVLITEADSLVGAALAKCLVSRGFAVAAASAIPNWTGLAAEAPSLEAIASGAASPLLEQEAEPSAYGPALVLPSGSGTNSASRCLAVRWNGRSPVSARAVLLAVCNAFDDIDEAIILEPPLPPAAEAVKISSADVERGFDGCKGVVFLAREILAHFLRRGDGVLSMVSYSPLPEEKSPPLTRAVHECFHGFASSLLESRAPHGLLLNGFRAQGVPPEEFAAFVDKTLDEKARKISGRWFNCQGRGGFLSSVLRTSSTR